MCIRDRSILGGLEYFRDKIQLNCHRLRVVREASEEMLLYQQTDMAQQQYFAAKEKFVKRLFNKDWQ